MTEITDLIAEALAPYTACTAVDGGARVATPCLYPGGDGVAVVVAPGEGGFRVSDDGGGWGALLAAGVEASPATHGRRARTIAELTGVDYAHGSFVAEAVSPDQVGAAIVLVANASQRWVTDVLFERQRRMERDLRRAVSGQLERLFPRDTIRHHARIAGETTKAYDFANVVTLPNRLLIVEPVANHANAIASAFLKLTDVHRAFPVYPREVVIEDQETWKSEDLAVLSEASDGIRDIAKGLETLRQKYAA